MLYVETIWPDGSSCKTNYGFPDMCPGVVHEVFGYGVSFSNYNMNNISDRKKDLH
jgi:hypothetical protein